MRRWNKCGGRKPVDLRNQRRLGVDSRQLTDQVNLTKANGGLHLLEPPHIPCQSDFVATSDTFLLLFFPSLFFQ